MILMKYILILVTLLLAFTQEGFAQRSASTILERIITSDDNVIAQGKVIEPSKPVFSLSGTYGIDDHLTYVVDYMGRGKEYNLFSLVYFDLESTDMLVVVNDDAYDSKNAYAGAYLFAENQSDDRDFPTHYGVACNLGAGPSLIQVYKDYKKQVYEAALADPSTDSLAYSFTLARLGQIVEYDLTPVNNAFATVDDFLNASDLSNLSATEVAAKLTAGLCCTAVDAYGVTWNLLCPVTSWEVDVKKKTASFYPMLVLKDFESEMTASQVLNAPDVNLAPDAPECITFSFKDGSPSSIAELGEPAVSVRAENGVIIVDGAEADVFSVEGRLVGRTSAGRLAVPAGFYVVRPHGAASLSVAVK